MQKPARSPVRHSTWRLPGASPGWPRTLCSFSGDAAAHQGETAEAKRYLDKSVALWTKANDRWGQARAMLDLGRVAIDSGEHTAAASVIAQSLTIYRELADAWGTALALETSAALAARTARPALALQLAEAAVELRQKADLVRSPRDSNWLAQRLRLSERALGSTGCAVARATGRELTMEDAIDLTLRVDGADRTPLLTRRERDVAGLIALGLTDSQIAQQLIVGGRTIESHRSTIRSKLGFKLACPGSGVGGRERTPNCFGARGDKVTTAGQRSNSSSSTEAPQPLGIYTVGDLSS
jgi:ATP/maltotriose-dependent transcriptional regulator MalT